MTYKQIVDRFKEIVGDHNQLQDFGYGQLSDIKTRHEGGTTSNADYPYLFLNYTSHTRSQQMITYNFNMIVMDMVKDDNFLKVQSDCQQYIDDVLARLRFYYTDRLDLDLSSISLTPFKERFQDTVAGMTATISLQAPVALNECIAPFGPVIPPVECTLTPNFIGVPTQVDQGSEVVFTDLSTTSGCDIESWLWTFEGGQPATATGQGPHTVTYPNSGSYDATLEIISGTEANSLTLTDYITVDGVQQETLIVDVGNSSPFSYDPETAPGVPTYDTVYLTDGNFSNNNLWIVTVPGTYRFTWEGDLYSGTYNPGDQWADPLTLIHDQIPNPVLLPPDVLDGWPTGNQTTITSANAIPIRLEWNNVVPTPSQGYFLNYSIDDPSKLEGQVFVKNIRWKIYRIN